MAEAAPRPDGSGQTIKSLRKGIDILETLAASRTPQRMADLAARLSMTPSSVSRLVATLREHGLVESEPGTGRLYIGLGAMVLGNASLGRQQLDQLARPWIMELSSQFEEHINLSRLYRGQVIYQRGAWQDAMVRAGIQLGGIIPLHCTAPGKVLIAWLPPVEAETALRVRGLPGFTASTITTMAAMHEELARIRETELAYDNEELAYGLRGAGVPIRGADGRVVAALSIGAATDRLQGEKLVAVERALRFAAGQISRELGYAGGLNDNG